MDDQTACSPVPTPPAHKSSLPAAEVVGSADRLRAEDNVSMTFGVDRKWHVEFKSTAAIHGKSMKELLMESFECWKREKQK